MNPFVSCEELAALLKSDRLFAVFDVRERGEYNQCQIPGTTSLPRSQIEFRLSRLVPNSGVSVVVYDEAEERASLAAETVMELGYRQVSILRGGITAWRSEAVNRRRRQRGIGSVGGAEKKADHRRRWPASACACPSPRSMNSEGKA